MINSLPRKIAAWNVAIIAISLVLAGILFVYLNLREYQETLAYQRLAILGGGVSRFFDDPQNQGFVVDGLKQIGSRFEFRILVTDLQGRVLVDTDDPAAKDIERVQLQTQKAIPSLTPAPETPKEAFAGEVRTASGHNYYYVSILSRPNDNGLRQSQFAVVVGQPQESLIQGLREVAPGLLRAGLFALLVTTPLVAFLAKSMSRPVRLMTRASEEMARGNYNQQIPVTSDDELGRLAQSFNTMAREVNQTHQTLRDLIGNVSHELKTPLTSIQGFSQALLDGAADSPEDRQRAVGIINEEANRMRRLVDDLLYISKLESGQIKLVREPVDLRALLHTIGRRLAWQIESKDVTLRLDVAGHPAALGDGHRLEGVFGNLMENAVRHTPSGGEIVVSTHTTARDTVEVVVHNSGSYIAPEEQSRVFERFYQVDRSRAQSGAGLGLSIVKELVQAHGGAVGVRSDPAAGTAFTVSLPAAPAGALEPAALPAGAGEPRAVSTRPL